MYRTYQIMISPYGSNKSLYHAFCKSMSASKQVYNQTMFFIRNLFSGMKKDASKRTANEKHVIEKTMHYLCEINEERAKRGGKPFHMPDEKHPVPSKNPLVMIMTRVFRNDFPIDSDISAKLVQNTVRQAADNFTSFCKSIKEYCIHPKKFLGVPKLPGYIRGEYFPLRYDNQLVSIKRNRKGCVLTFGKCSFSLYLGEVCPEKVVEAKVKMFHDRIKLDLCYEDCIRCKTHSQLNPNRMLGIDVGVKIFAAVCTNFEANPFLIRGGRIRSLNWYYNKQKAELQSQLIKDCKRYNSRQIDLLERYRYCCMQDFFHKTARYIVNYALNHSAGTIVIGHNDGWKQHLRHDKIQNQKFVQIPFNRFIAILKDKGEREGIRVVVVEESYTSQASLMDHDVIPVYREKSEHKKTLRGRRAHRGLYRTAEGQKLHADINGAGNIIRKYRDDAMPQDLSYLLRTVECINVA